MIGIVWHCVTGQIVFDALGQTDILGVGEVSRVLTEALISLGHQKNAKPLEYVGKFLLDHAGFSTQQFSLSQPKKVSVCMQIRFFYSNISYRTHNLGFFSEFQTNFSPTTFILISQISGQIIHLC